MYILHWDILETWAYCKIFLPFFMCSPVCLSVLKDILSAQMHYILPGIKALPGVSKSGGQLQVTTVKCLWLALMSVLYACSLFP